MLRVVRCDPPLFNKKRKQLLKKWVIIGVYGTWLSTPTTKKKAEADLKKIIKAHNAKAEELC